ncbi:hypothetical protein HKW67_18830 [Gemmatimonas groenlandica]|uniref:Uncharacterized protein n=2 Tax=Gemmatimonas groenlandica TaxID=2732249 RepID=A0A6M4ITG7_9BACT|nr:hypothetical protein HKW67_18830 [Gemmatimonas groenlandica]
MPAPGAAPALKLRVLYPVLVLALGAALLLRLRPATFSAREQAAVQRAALLALFDAREHAKRLVFWSDTTHLSPTLQLLRDSGVPFEAQPPDTAALALPLPVHLESLATLEQQFRAEPDGWEAWFARYPASSGLVALTRPTLLAQSPDGTQRDALSVAVIVARTCGEHCHSAWRVTLIRDRRNVWQVRAIEPLTLPRD